MRTHRKLSGGGGTGRISPLGYNFVDLNGRIVIRKSITGFCAPKRFAEGRGHEARNFFDWAASRGFNEVRVFSRVDWSGPPNGGVESGWQFSEPDLRACIVEAKAAGLRVEVVVHTGKFGTFDDMVNHLRRADEICLEYENTLLEIYNEPQQNGGNDLVGNLINRYKPRTPGWMSGVYDQTPYPAGPAMTYHSPRKDEWSRCFKDAYEYSTGQGPNTVFAPGYPGPVMQDEPPQVEQTVRDAGHAGWDPVDDWKAYGCGSALFACGATMHSNPGLQQCTIPTDPTVLRCIDAFIEGLNTPPVQRYHGYNRTDPPSSNPGSRSYHRWGDDNKQYKITVRPFSFGVV